MYVANYEMFAGVPTFHQDAEHRYICAPICLLYLNSKSELIPIAIQVRVTSSCHCRCHTLVVTFSLIRIIVLDEKKTTAVFP